MYKNTTTISYFDNLLYLYVVLNKLQTSSSRYSVNTHTI